MNWKKEAKSVYLYSCLIDSYGGRRNLCLQDSVVVMNVEAEPLDSLTGRRMNAIVQTRANEVHVKNQDVYPVLDFWARKLKKPIDRIHGSWPCMTIVLDLLWSPQNKREKWCEIWYKIAYIFYSTSL